MGDERTGGLRRRPAPRRGQGGAGPATPYAFLAPLLFLFGLFGLLPLAQSMVLAFHATAGPDRMAFVGLGNFVFLAGDADFHTAVRNTVVFTASSLLIQVPLGLGLALLLNDPALAGRRIFRFAFFAPYLVGHAFAGVLFTLVLNPRFGLINRVLAGLDRMVPFVRMPTDLRWLQDADLVMPATILVAAWLGTGLNMVYFLAALQGVDRTLYQAARADGAGRWGQFLHVTLPGIRPVLVFVVVITTIFSFRIFELPWLLNGGMPGPENSGLFIITYLYQQGFIVGDLGYASAIGWVLTVGVVALALVQIRGAAFWGGAR